MPDLLGFGKGFILCPPSINRPPQHQGSLKSVFQAAFHALLAPAQPRQLRLNLRHVLFGKQPLQIPPNAVVAKAFVLHFRQRIGNRRSAPW